MHGRRRPSGAGAASQLVRRFAVVSFLVIALITAALCVVVSRYLRNDLLTREWGLTADFIRTETLYHVTAQDFAAPDTAKAQGHFVDLYKQAVSMPEIVRVKIYDTTTTIVWSDEPRLIGLSFVDNPELKRAMSGRTTVDLEVSGRKGENVFERDESELVEVYVPIVFPGTGRVAGVVETYKEPRQVLASIRRVQLAVIGTALAGALILYLSLVGFVRRAGRRIESQHGALEQRTAEATAANEELRTVQAQLVEAGRMAAIGEVVSAVAHGIRNPLAGIRAAAQVALLDCRTCTTSSAAARSLSSIVTEVDRLEARMRELLQFVRPTERQSRPVYLNEALCGALHLMAARLAERGIAVKEELALVLPVVTGDPMLLEQVFLSLLGNAVEAMPQGGTITVRTGTAPGADGRVAVFAEVADTGPGIPAEDLSRIFAPFYTTKAQGTGLGLAMAKKFTEAHGGTIAVRSEPGAGAAFRVTSVAGAPA